VRPASVVGERASRLLSPAGFILALVCCVFTFAGVSCNTATAKQAVSGFAGSAAGATSAQVTAVDQCLDELGATNLVSYSGISLMIGGSPSRLTQLPAGCRQSGSGSNQSLSPAEVAVPAQPLGIGALAAMGAGVLLGAVLLLLRLRARVRLTLALLLGALAFLLLLFNQLHAHAVISRTLDAAAAGRGAPFSIVEFFTVNDGIAWFLALAALAAGVLYNGVAILALAGVITEPAADTAGAPPRTE
jgi:hypothetical protein